MKALKASRKAHDAHLNAELKSALRKRFIRGLRCPYCGHRCLPEHMPKHIDGCSIRKHELKDRQEPVIDPDFPTLGKPVRGTMRWKILSGET